MMKRMLSMHRLVTHHAATNASRSLQQQQQQQLVAAAASCLVAATALSMSVAVACDYNNAEQDDHDDVVDGGGKQHCPAMNPSQEGRHRSRATNSLALLPTQQHDDAATIFASSPILSKTEPGNTSHDKPQPRTRIIACDYAIIGHGKAGRSAARTIERLDPTANIVIIDPSTIHSDSNINNHATTTTTTTIGRRKSTSSFSCTRHYLQTRANFIDHAQKMIHVHPPPHINISSSLSSSLSTDCSETHNIIINNNNNNIIVQYRKSALLATGSRGAPPPECCTRDDARARILELRTTSTLSATVRRPQSLKATTANTSNAANQSTASLLPVLDPRTVRSLSSMAVSQGATLAIMGSGFEALELAAHCARIAASASSSKISKRAQTKQQKQQQGDDSNVVSNNKVKLLFGNSSPMSNRLPRYLGVAVTKRLRQNGIDVEDRTMTRYIAMNRPTTPSSTSGYNSSSSNGSGNSEVSHSPPQLEIYTVKSYDHMDTTRQVADLLVLAPSVDGLNGTAVIPNLTSNSPDGNHDTSPSSSTATATKTTPATDYLPWSSLISPPLLTCYLDDGRIVTNAELNAGSSLYAAGSVARFPNLRTGRAEISGGRHVSAEHAGEVAARNMVGGSDSIMGGTAPCYMKESIPVWRSDRIPYAPMLPADEKDDNDLVSRRHHPSSSSTLALYSMGIHALCVGRCDSECMATHGFWWTNQSAIHSAQLGVGKDDVIGKSMDGPNAFMRRATRRVTNSSSNAKSSNRGSLPVYGSGVVFYLDRSGNIEGIMLWGLPYTENPNHAQSHHLNTDLVERLKTVIRSNGGVSVSDHSDIILRNHPGMNNLDISLLSYLHLAEESKYLATLAFKGTSNSRVVLGRPLHRYTPIKSVELSNIGKMHRKDEAGHATEEDDLFYSSMASSTDDDTMQQRMIELGRPPSLKRIYPMQDMTSLAGTDRFSRGTSERENRKLQIERSRPPKEEPLWMRHGDEHRFVSKRDVVVDSFLRNIQAGRFSDGSDAVKQAPVPKIYLDVKEKWSSWNSGVDNETDND